MHVPHPDTNWEGREGERLRDRDRDTKRERVPAWSLGPKTQPHRSLTRTNPHPSWVDIWAQLGGEYGKSPTTGRANPWCSVDRQIYLYHSAALSYPPHTHLKCVFLVVLGIRICWEKKNPNCSIEATLPLNPMHKVHLICSNNVFSRKSSPASSAPTLQSLFWTPSIPSSYTVSFVKLQVVTQE